MERNILILLNDIIYLYNSDNLTTGVHNGLEEALNGLQTTQPTCGGAVTTDTNSYVNCV